ncbi:MAG: hypothetical protein ABEJ89_09035 [Haloarculaceae archaeon]
MRSIASHPRLDCEGEASDRGETFADLPGSTSPEHIRQNVAASEGTPLDH